MIKANDKTLSTMQKAACSEDIPDLPAHIALLSSLSFWRKYDFYKQDKKVYFFTHLILNPVYFSENDIKIARKLSICQKCVQNYRKDFKTQFLQDYLLFQSMNTAQLLSIRQSLLWILEGFALPLRFSSKHDTLSSCVLSYFSQSDFQAVK